MRTYKKPSEIRQYCKFVIQIRLTMFSVIPLIVGVYLWLGSEKNIAFGMIYAFFFYFLSIIPALFVLNRRYTEEQVRKLARFKQKFFRHYIRRLVEEIFILIAIIISAYLIVDLLNIKYDSGSFVPFILVGLVSIFLRPSIRDPDDAEYGIDDEALEEEYVFSEYSSSRPDNFLMDPSHPSSILNPTNPASPSYHSYDR